MWQILGYACTLKAIRRNVLTLQRFHNLAILNIILKRAYVQITRVCLCFYSYFVTVDYFNPTSFHNTFCCFFSHLTISGPGHDLHLFTCSTVITVFTLNKYDTILCFLILSFKFTNLTIHQNGMKWWKVKRKVAWFVIFLILMLSDSPTLKKRNIMIWILTLLTKDTIILSYLTSSYLVKQKLLKSMFMKVKSESMPWQWRI